MPRPAPESISISDAGDVSVARKKAKKMAAAIGFSKKDQDEIELVASELASNLVKHADSGALKLMPCKGESNGIQIESLDGGPGIADVDNAVADGFSTGEGLGCGLGTVNRLVDEFDISSMRGKRAKTHIVCRRWLSDKAVTGNNCPLSIGAATQPHPQMKVNGDDFVIKKWGRNALVAVIDGLGHGQYAHRASRKAREYIEKHYDRPLGEIFLGVARSCRATRGVVMTLAHFDTEKGQVTVAGIGNVEVRLMETPQRVGFVIRRGIIGGQAPRPVVTEQAWDPKYLMVLYSDGLRTHWSWKDFAHLKNEPASAIAQELLKELARDNDDATVVVVKGAAS